jgi:uncharacterized protein (TIGR00297 family)
MQIPPPDREEFMRLAMALMVATALATRGRRRGALTTTGAYAAFLVGMISWVTSARFGATLIAFYQSSTHATRFRAREKATFEDGHSTASGNRGATQVLASSLPAVLLALAHLALHRFDAPLSSASPADAQRSALALAYLLFFASCAGDTFASELGSVLPSPDRPPALIIPPWTNVPRGTNGGVTWEGTAASAVGGAVVGFVFFLAAGPDGWVRQQMPLVPLSAAAGLVGSALDSAIGAVFQISLLDPETGKVCKQTPKKGSAEAKRVSLICGRDLLTGEAVNAIASTVTAALAPIIVWLVF